LRRLKRRGCELGELLDVVDQARDQAHRLAGAGVAAALPGVADSRKPAGEVGVRCVEQPPHCSLARPRHQQVGLDIIVEEILEQVGSMLHVLALAVQVLVGIDQARFPDVRCEVAHWRSFLPSIQVRVKYSAFHHTVKHGAARHQ
jgi:hypothetical protein